MTAPHDLRAVILAGGSGTRLWPLSRRSAPKQFVPLMGEESLLEATIRRLEPLVAADRVLVVASRETATGEGYRALQPYETLVEPVPRNTAAAIGIAALRFRLEGLDPVLVVLPSDHLVRDVPAFQAALLRAVEAAATGKLVTFGVHPTRPETGYGYIEAAPGPAPRAVVSFHEKPDRATALRFVASADFYWNSGMFAWRASAILREIGSALPALAAVLAAIEADARARSLPEALERHFGEAPAISIDHGVLEKSRDLVMVPGDFGWSDVGTWDAVYDAGEKDGDGNVVQGSVVALECRDSLIRSQGRLVAALGVSDVAIVETADAVLVARRGAGQDLRRLVDALASREAGELEAHPTVQRPWGSYTVLHEGPGFKIKRIEVRPAGRLSLQRHRHRSEHWVVVAGVATVTSGGRRVEIAPNESAYIPAGVEHRLENRGEAPAQIIEVQVGSYVGEDDIERLDDVYGRAKAASEP